jgi:hypothetical protein
MTGAPAEIPLAAGVTSVREVLAVKRSMASGTVESV